MSMELTGLSNVDLKSQSLIIHSTTFDEWMNMRPTLDAFDEASKWWYGDYFLYGEEHFGEEFSQAFGKRDPRPYIWVSKAFTPERRKDVSWSHHRIVAKYSEVEQDDWLDRTIENDWSVAELREEINISEGKEPKKKLDKKAIILLSMERVHQTWTADDHDQVMEYLGSG